MDRPRRRSRCFSAGLSVDQEQRPKERLAQTAFYAGCMATYPPEHHLLRDLQPQAEWVSDDECIFTAPVVPQTRSATGALALGPMFAVTDLALISTAIGFADGDWCGTLDLAIRSGQPIVDGPLVVACQVVRIGGTLITTKAELLDGDRLAGTAIATSRRMPRNPDFNDAPPDEKVVGTIQHWGRASSGFTLPVNDQLGLTELAPGAVELAKTPYVTNSFGTVNGGTSGILLCAGAESALGGEFVATDIEVRYIGQAAEGPVRTMSEIIRVERDHAVVDVTAVDMSRERRPIATAGVTLTLLA
jgi:acyl-coenzyme A thioesterase PaaI-like protein